MKLPSFLCPIWNDRNEGFNIKKEKLHYVKLHVEEKRANLRNNNKG